MNPALRSEDFTRYASSSGFVRKSVTIGDRPGDAEAFMSEMMAFPTAALR